MLESAFQMLLLFCTGLVAGLVDTIAGGGGLITIPVLLGLGLAPQMALGTNKLQACFGSGSATLAFIRKGTVKLEQCRQGILWTAAGAALGAFTVQLLDPSLLKQLIPWLLMAIVIYTVMSPRLGLEDIHPRMAAGPFFLLGGVSLGFYDGFLGPGVGSFWVMALVFALGFNLTKATGYTKVMNFTSNFVALLLFIVGGHVLWREGLIMGLGQFFGARIGAHLVVSRGARFIRPVFIFMVVTITVSLIWQNLKSG